MPGPDIAETAFCQTILLDDSPTTEDAFRHQEIASAISNMVINERGGRAIALTGPWGSGKSTVIQLLKQAVESSGSTKVITFDAWAHQGDPLRRTFLEQAIKTLDTWISNQEKWRDKLDILAGRLVITETTSTPNITWWGAFGALSLVLAPIGLALSSFLKDVTGTSHPKWTVVAFSLTLAPLAWALLLLIRWGYLRSQNQKVPLPSLTYTSNEDRKITESNLTPEPTSVEFESDYSDLLTDALGDKHRKILFVIDNLDRLSDDDAKAVWSTLRIFFDAPLRNKPWYQNVWILVPFDERAVARLWENGNGTKEIRKGAQFIEKTFQAFFRVPPPILTGWERFILSQLQMALPGHKNDPQLRTIFYFYDQMRPPSSPVPTPRELKLFVNTLGSLHRQWQHTIPLVTQAAFVLKLTK